MYDSRHKNFIIVLLFLLIAYSSRKERLFAQEPVFAGVSTRSETSTGVTLWAAPAEQKIRPDDNPENNNLVWSGNAKKITLTGAGNEHVPFQVIITADLNAAITPEDFWMEISDLSTADGGRINKEHIDFYLEHYIFLTERSSPVGAIGYWPDALAPLKNTFNMNAQFGVVKNRPLWVDLFVPEDTKGGTYTGTITVTQHGEKIETITVEINVYHFSLPDETPLITYMNVARDWLAEFYDKPEESEAIEKLTQRYYDKLYASRMEPWFNDMLLPVVTVRSGQVEVRFNDERYLYYMNILKTKRVLFDAFPYSLRRQIVAAPFTPECNALVKSYLSQVETYFKQNGWHDRLVFNSPIDEPNSMQAYEDTRRWATLVKEATTGVPFLVTKTPVPPKSHPEWGTFQGYVDNFSIHGNHLNDPDIARVIKEEKAKGGELTWYISCDQAYPQPNYFIDAPAMDLVMLPWITARYDMDGILYWGINFWEDTSNPWLDANTFLDGIDCSEGWTLNGEGSVWYPGDFVNQYTGQPDVDGPVSSIRFELLREGIEDHVYLSMLAQLGDKAFADGVVAGMAVDVRNFSRDVPALYNARKSLAARIEQLLPTDNQQVAPPHGPEAVAYMYNGVLHIQSPSAETVQAYSVRGELLFNIQKQAGSVSYPMNRNMGEIIFLRGSSGWTKKILNLK